MGPFEEMLDTLKRIEKKLIDKAANGNGRAFEELIRNYDRQIMNLLLNILKNEDDA